MNALGQRTNLATSGTAFPGMPAWLWGYDSRGQIISADSNANTSDRAYQYDGIGNRQKAAAGTLDVNDPAATLYAANGLNQYSQINSNSITSNTTYDADGNMTSGPLPVDPNTNSTLVWDAENRLISTTTGTNTKTNLYDAQSRRIYSTQSPIPNPQSTLYVYDGFNCIAEYTGTTLSKTRLWGIDLSGSMQGAGGVGGILSESSPITQNPITFNTYVPTYDGNGNVSEYLDSTGTAVAHYEYDPFGNTVVATGPKANGFAYRFSTKPLDQATGLYYYQYRYYDPVIGRWPSRDPIQERGGVNLYGFVRNNGTSRIDILGQLEFNFGGGFGGGATLLLPAGGTYSVGFSIFYSGFVAVGVDTKRSSNKIQCAVCHSGAVSVLFGSGVAANVSAGPVFTFGPSGDLNDLSGFSIQIGAGGGIPTTPALVGPSKEVTVDVDIKTKQVTVVVPKAGLGITAYAAIRVTGSCTGCTGIFRRAAIRNTKLTDCMKNLRSAIDGAFALVQQRQASATTETRVVYTHPKEISIDSRVNE